MQHLREGHAVQEPRILVDCLLATCTSTIAIVVLRRYAILFGLVDHPSKRKQHVGHVPLVGGLAIFMGVTVGAACYGQFHWFEKSIISTAFLLTLIGALDDRFDLSVRGRLFVQAIAVIAVIAVSGVYIHTLGNLFGHEINLEWLGPPLTILAIIGLVNAFNMMDGIDGLAGSLELVSIAAIALYSGADNLRGSLILLILLGTASVPYLMANLGMLGNKIFLGDAGSMLIGYLLAWTLIHMSQAPQAHLSPVDVLWCVGLPVSDTLAVMCRRMSQGKSPFKPDRGHVHHILLRAGLSHRATLLSLIAIAASFACVGAALRHLTASSGLHLAAFIVIMFAYGLTATIAWFRQEAAQKKQADVIPLKSIPRPLPSTASGSLNSARSPMVAGRQ
ncbi:undecaprenyl-phosphate alpha-N-acetylglucosaminyl 1-phosphate transferase [Dyella japonica]|uniref:UDP-phosphate N-acetylglucosaminyl-1-phosphate transferase n=1 Tax=Dyella japonica A8 TaxID=1217721 RepID=A0A075K2K1_9GAMM|nr:undecaprenyl-phosphate alpha-N-acetylglucosaminyl 1-phosphate transferase [Dyella japonica]AIF47937.1 UDP-phosphate N-acetylglucosaminyl-1-phosphate transferase [Dyella japonica A8]